MTRIENQLTEMRAELARYEAFATEQNAKFLNDLNAVVIPALWKYKIGVTNPTENTFIDKGLCDSSKLYFRVYLKGDFHKISGLQAKRLEKTLRDAGVPMPICPISFGSINLVYTNK